MSENVQTKPDTGHAPDPKRAKIAVSAATASCIADGHKCSCAQFGWQFFAGNHQCNARLSAAYETLKLVESAAT